MSGDAISPAMMAIRRELSIPDGDAIPDRGDADVRLLCWMLRLTQPWPGAAAETLQALRDAHRAGVDDAVAWRRLRRAAVALGTAEDEETRVLAGVAEAVAWPLSTSNAGLTEMLRALSALRAARAAAATGWTRADEAEAHAVLERIAAGDAGSVPARHEIPVLFAATHPELERRFIKQLQASNAVFAAVRGEVAAWIAGAGR